MLNIRVDRPVMTETTALGAAYLAGLSINFYPNPDAFAELWQLDKCFEPSLERTLIEKKYNGWLDCVERTRR
jgi:glycerol kinase